MRHVNGCGGSLNHVILSKFWLNVTKFWRRSQIYGPDTKCLKGFSYSGNVFFIFVSNSLWISISKLGSGDISLTWHQDSKSPFAFARLNFLFAQLYYILAPLLQTPRSSTHLYHLDLNWIKQDPALFLGATASQTCPLTFLPQQFPLLSKGPF